MKEKKNEQFNSFLIFNCRQIHGNGKDPAHISLEQNILSCLAGTEKLCALQTLNWWSQVKTAGSAIYANRHYLVLYKTKMPQRLASVNGDTCHIIGDVYIHPSATVDKTAVVNIFNNFLNKKKNKILDMN